ncbi:hypothetical protein ACE02B_11375 [Shewanella mangrovisoli]|uniref:hypothetical protein n=1 Tax=Shewanella mangrovisoli TaxID=2864211 RepID=UPI0035B87129
MANLKQIRQLILVLSERKRTKAVIEQLIVELCQAAYPHCLKYADIAHLLTLLQRKRVLPIITDKFKRFVDTFMSGF